MLGTGITVRLDERSKHTTTFISIWGRYRYLRAVQGYKASGDAYTKRYDDITLGFLDMTRIVDDTCLWKPSIEELFWHTCQYITLCSKNGIIYYPKKLVLGRKTVEFAGFTVTEDSIKPTQRMVEAIGSFPAPTTTKGVRSWFGLVNQVAYAYANSDIMAPFRELLRKNVKFYWDDTLDRIFEQSKREIVEQVKDGVKMFSPDRVTCLATDWSKVGIGFFLLLCLCFSLLSKLWLLLLFSCLLSFVVLCLLSGFSWLLLLLSPSIVVVAVIPSVLLLFLFLSLLLSLLLSLMLLFSVLLWL